MVLWNNIVLTVASKNWVWGQDTEVLIQFVIVDIRNILVKEKREKQENTTSERNIRVQSGFSYMHFFLKCYPCNVNDPQVVRVFSHWLLDLPCWYFLVSASLEVVTGSYLFSGHTFTLSVMIMTHQSNILKSVFFTVRVGWNCRKFTSTGCVLLGKNTCL